MGKKKYSKILRKTFCFLIVICLLVASVPVVLAGDAHTEMYTLVNAVKQESTGTRSTIIGFLVANKTDYKLKPGIVPADTAKDIQKIFQVEPGKSITVTNIQKGVQDLIAYYNASDVNKTAISLTLSQLDKDLKVVAVPNGLGSLKGKIEEDFIAYDLFVNFLLTLKTLNANQTLMYKPYNDDKLIIEDSLKNLYNIAIGLAGNEKTRLQSYYNRLVGLLDKTNNWTLPERKVLIEDLKNWGVARYESAPSNPSPGPSGSTGGSTTPPPSGGTGDSGSTGQVQNDLNAINNLASGTSGTMDAGTVGQIANKIENIVNTINNISNPATALTQAEKVIENLGTALTNAASAGTATEGIVAAVENLAQAVMDKVERTNVITAVTGSNATISLATDTVNQLIGKLDTIVQTANTLNGKLAAAGTGIGVKAVLKIKADAGANVNDVTAKLPAELIAAAQQKKIDKIAVETGLATLTIAPDAIAVTAGSTLSLETRIPTAAEVNNAVSELAAKTNMTPEQVQSLQNDLKGATVYDLNAFVGTSKFTDSFSKPVDVAVPYTLKAGDNSDNITVYYINDSGVLENVSGAYDPVTKTVKFSTWHFSKYVIKLNNVTFKDVATSNWAKKHIEAMAAKGVITGTGDSNFEPNGNLTRAQFAAMIVRLFKLSDAGASVSFSDVKPGQWFYKEVAAAVKAGIITGRGDGTFAPDENITRQDMVVIIARAVTKFKNGSIPADTSKILVKYGDKDKIADYAKGSIALSSTLGIIDGMPGGIFMPQGLSTRAQAAKIIYSVFNLK